MCLCAPGWAGSECGANIDECASTPCSNGGVCVDGVDAFSCTCAAGWSGSTCNVDIDECQSAPCLHNATCADSTGNATIAVDSYLCSCAVGFAGETCGQNVDECASMPCQNGGVCMDGNASYTCACAPGWEGSVCQTEIIPCAAGEADCDANANCSHIGPGLHVCTCVTGFVGSGQSCTDVDECASEPCEHGGRCVAVSYTHLTLPTILLV